VIPDQAGDRQDSRQAWLILTIASTIMGMGAGSLISISTFLTPLVQETGWSRGAISFGYTLSTLSVGIGGIAMGYISDRFSTRPVAVFGILFLSASLFLLSTLSELWQFYLYCSLLGGLGASTFDAPLLSSVGNWFNRSKGLALGMCYAIRGLGQGLIPFVGGLLIASSGWRDAYMILGGFCLIALLPLAFFIKDPPGLKEHKEASRRAKPAEREADYPMAPGAVVVWLTAAAIGCCVCMGTAMVHVVSLAEGAGFSTEDAAWVILLIYFSGFFGRIVTGKAADHIGGVRAYWLASFCQTVLIFGFTEIDTLMIFYIYAAIFGFGMSGVMTGLVVCVRELIPVHARGLANGIVIFAAWTGMGLGGYQGGLFYDLTGSYVTSFANAMAFGFMNLCVVGAFLIFYQRKMRALTV
jgi:MFS family permease